MKKICLIIALAGITSTVSAQSFKPGVYLGGEFGISKVDNEAQALANTLVAQAGGSAVVTQDTSISVGRAFIGYKLTENIDLELGYFQTGDAKSRFAGVTGGNVAYNGEITLSASGFDYSALLRPSLSSGLNNAFLRVGAHSSETKIDITGSAAINRRTVTTSGTGMLFGGGYDFNISNNVDMRVQATRMLKIAGESDQKTTIYSIGILGKF